MAGRRVQIAWERADSSEALRERYRREGEGQVRTRLHALWLLRTGWSMEEVAGIVGVHYRTVQRWVGWYRNGGVGEVCAHHGGGHGQAAWLTQEQEAAVADEAAKGTFITASDVRQWVAEQFGVTYRCKGIYGLLRRVRCRPKVPRPIHTKPDPQAQETWKKGAAAQPCGRPK